VVPGSKRCRTFPLMASISSNSVLPSSSLGKPLNPGMADAVIQSVLLFGSVETARVGQRLASAASGSSCIEHSLLPSLGKDTRYKVRCWTLDTTKLPDDFI